MKTHLTHAHLTYLLQNYYIPLHNAYLATCHTGSYNVFGATNKIEYSTGKFKKLLEHRVLTYLLKIDEISNPEVLLGDLIEFIAYEAFRYVEKDEEEEYNQIVSKLNFDEEEYYRNLKDLIERKLKFNVELENYEEEYKNVYM